MAVVSDFSAIAIVVYIMYVLCLKILIKAFGFVEKLLCRNKFVSDIEFGLIFRPLS